MFPVIPRNQLAQFDAMMGQQRQLPMAGFYPNYASLLAGQTMPRGGGLTPVMPGAGKIATLQNPNQGQGQAIQTGPVPADQLPTTVAPVRADTYHEMAPMILPNMTDTELARTQLNRGGRMAESVLGSAPTLTPQGTMDYSKVTPFRGGMSELVKNPKFIQLASSNPQAASQLYQSLTSRDMNADMDEQQKIELARQIKFSGDIRSGIMQGEIRQHPETGFIERKVQIPNPKDPMGGKMDAWDTMDYEGQMAATQHWSNATGEQLPRANPIASLDVPAGTKALILQRYKEYVSTGQMGIREAMEQAMKSVPPPNSNVKVMTAPSSTAVATAHAQAANKPEPPSTYDPDFQIQMEQEGARQASAISNFAEDNIVAPLVKGVESIGNWWNDETELNRVMNNVNTGLFNTKKRLGLESGPFRRDMSVEEFAVWKAKKQAAETAARQAPTPMGVSNYPLPTKPQPRLPVTGLWNPQHFLR